MKTLGQYIDELRSLDQHNIGSWPAWAYGFAISVVALVIMLVAVWYFVLPKHEALVSARAKEDDLRAQVAERAGQVANLEAYRDQLAQMKAEFADLLAQLPSRTEVPSLLRDISQARSANGLDETLFKPQPEVARDFYAELPNDLVVTGDFHDFARFVSDVAALPRIVTIQDIRIEGADNGAASNGANSAPLRMSLTATTYRYIDKPAGADTGKKTATGTGNR